MSECRIDDQGWVEWDLRLNWPNFWSGVFLALGLVVGFIIGAMCR